MAPHRNSTSTAASPPALPAFSRLAARFTLATAAAAASARTIGLGFAGAASAATTARDAAHASTGKQVGLAEPDLITKSAKVQASELAAMKAVGITSIRLDADWGGVQYAGRNSFSWGPLDQVVRSVRAAGMSVDLIIDGCPAWAAKAGTSGDVSPPPASPAAFATFAAQVAARYAPAGVRMFEIWNEPNNAGFWSPKPDPAAYTADLKAAYASIKKVDRSAFVLSGGLAPEANDGTNINPVSYLQDMYTHGAKGSFDAVSYHPYSYPALPDSYQSWSGWSQMSQTRPSIRGVMTSRGDSRKQVWITEVGAPSSGPDGVGQAAQGTDLSQAIANTRNTSWIGGLYLYSWQDHGTSQATSENWFGLVTAAGAHKAAYTAVAAALRR
jgi:polysaccharide biosynthesis protein PslG